MSVDRKRAVRIGRHHRSSDCSRPETGHIAVVVEERHKVAEAAAHTLEREVAGKGNLR